MEKIPTFFSSTITEHELASEIDHMLKQYGASSTAFETISSFGPNTAKPHYACGKREIQGGDFIICDFGATVDHYHSDTTRTFVYGKANDKQKRMHQTVLAAQNKALQSIKPGVMANTIHQITKEVIDETEFNGYFIHSTGHGLGLEVHDPGIGFADAYENKLQPGMVLTVEPGIYIPEFGGVRIEDDIVVTPDGHIQLTCSPKKLIEIPQA
jgi:Xaa-Pro aminopeptidase